MSVAFSKEEATRRGYPQLEGKPGPGYSPEPNFCKYIVVWFKGDRVTAFRVNLDWGL